MPLQRSLVNPRVSRVERVTYVLDERSTAYKVVARRHFPDDIELQLHVGQSLKHETLIVSYNFNACESNDSF
jgi:hypothetical protein